MKLRVYALLITILFLPACKPVSLDNTPTGTLLAPTITRNPYPTRTFPQSTPTATLLPTLTGSGGGVIVYGFASTSGLMQLNVINLDGSEDRKLIGSRYGFNHPDWSSDGKKIVAVSYMDPTYETWSIFVLNADGSDPVRLTHTNGAADTEPAWSPDGKIILFSRIKFLSSTQFRSDLWMMNADGSDQRIVVENGFAGKWSPDGISIIYSSNKAGNYEIYTSNITGTDEMRLTDSSTNESYPVWSPDGNLIAYSVSKGEWNSPESGSTYEIYIMNADGTEKQQLTDNNAGDGTPRWSPDGSMIAFSSDRTETEHYEVFVMNVDGTNIKQVTHTPTGTRAINPVWRPVP